MNASLAQSAFAFESAKDKNGLPPDVPFERLTPEVWRFIEAKLPNCYPDWFKELTCVYRLLGGHLFLPVDPTDPMGYGTCHLLRPSEWLIAIYSAYNEPLHKLSALGFAPFADAEDGNLWVFRKDDGDDPRVYFVSAGLWGGHQTLTEENGLFPTYKTLSEFLDYGANWNDEETINEMEA